MIFLNRVREKKGLLLLFLLPIFPLAVLNSFGLEGFAGIFTEYFSGACNKVIQFFEI
jgi:hypothetical protein